MERPLFKPVGTPVKQLDTPALVVDVAALEHNITIVHTFFAHQAAKLRPHVSAHRCPLIARRQLAADGTVGGLSVTTLGEAEVFAAHGFPDIFIATGLVTRPKMQRLGALARQARITVVIDQQQHLQQLAAVAASHGITLHVAIQLRSQDHDAGAEPGAAAVELAQAIERQPHLAFAGLSTTLAPVLEQAPVRDAAALQRLVQPLLDTRRMVEAAGMAVPMVSVGGTSAYEYLGALAGVTEVRCGSYALMDAQHQVSLPRLRPAARVLTTVTSHPEPGIAVTDTGQKAIGIDRGLPVVDDLPGVKAARLSAEHCCLELTPEAANTITPGEKLWLIPRDIGTCVNLYDNIYACRDSRLEAVWSVAARGQYR